MPEAFHEIAPTPAGGVGVSRMIHPWFAVRVRSNCERIAAHSLHQRGLEILVPSYPSRSRWSDRVKVIDKPLFPGYVFCRFDPLERGTILRSPGVVHIVGNGRELLPIEEKEIEYIQTVILTQLEITPHPFLKIGQKVLIERGPLTGVEGVLTTFKGRFRIVVSISLLQRSIATEIEADWIKPF